MHNLAEARKLYDEALAENGLTRETIPTITVSYVGSERARIITRIIKENIKEAFNLDIELEELTVEPLAKKLITKEYSLALSSWLADYLDPMSFLNVFASDTNGINNTGWTNIEYSRLLTNASVEFNETKRLQLMNKAQEVLMQGRPILPLFHVTFTYATHNDLQGDILSPLGILDATRMFRVNKK